MPQFYSVSNNTFSTRGYPWIDKVVEGVIEKPPCPRCGGISRDPYSEVTVTLERNKGTKWPDALGCGALPLFIVSGHVIEAWEKERIGEFPVHRVRILPPYPKRLEGTQAPVYFWVDGKKLKGALLDFDASGFVEVTFCPKCGRRTDDIAATYARQHSAVWPYVFRPGSWNGSNLFTTDLSYAAFFCTDAVVECATKYRHTNFRFIPVEEGDAIDSKGLKYLR